MNDLTHESDHHESDHEIAGKRVLIGLSGGIACYKIATLVSRLVQRQAIVRVVMTEAATRFITPLTLQSLSGNSVITGIWQTDDRPDSQHIGLARWCDAFVLAPASANTIAKLAHGFTDDAVSLAASAIPQGIPKLFAPAMNADMWANPVIQQNASILRETLGMTQIGPDPGWQACRTLGEGRMTEPETILQKIIENISK